MRRALSIVIVAAVPLAPHGGRAVDVTETGNAPQPPPQARSNVVHHPAKVKAAGAGSVSIKDFSFGPSSITVHVGDTVTWSNGGPAEHTATASNGSFDTGILKKGQSGSHTFNTAGSFSYICSVHPFMKGTVVVEAAAGSSTGSTSNSTPKAAGSAATPEPGTPGAAAPAQTGGLPATGLDVWWLVLPGAMLVASGLVLRRRLPSGG